MIVSGPDETFRDHPGDRVSPEWRGDPVRVQSHGGLGGREKEPKLRLADGSVESHLVPGIAFAIPEGPVVEPNLTQRGIIPGHSRNVSVKALLAVGGAIGSVEQHDVRAIDGAQLPRRLALRRVGRNKTEPLQGKLGPYVLATLVAQMNGEIPGFGADIPVTAVITGKLQMPSARRPVETLIREFVKHRSPIESVR